MENRGVLSTLQFAIREKGVFHGFVGFDDCKVAACGQRSKLTRWFLLDS